jgi:hypothetical protein
MPGPTAIFNGGHGSMAEHRAVNADVPVRLRLVTPNSGPLAERRGSGLLIRTTQVRILQGPPEIDVAKVVASFPPRAIRAAGGAPGFTNPHLALLNSATKNSSQTRCQRARLLSPPWCVGPANRVHAYRGAGVAGTANAENVCSMFHSSWVEQSTNYRSVAGSNPAGKQTPSKGFNRSTGDGLGGKWQGIASCRTVRRACAPPACARERALASLTRRFVNA